MKKYLLIAAALALTACGGQTTKPPVTSTPPTSQIPNAPFNQQQTAKLIGDWTFNFELTNKYRLKYTLSDLIENPNPDGNYNVSGESEGGSVVTASYQSQYSHFLLSEYAGGGYTNYLYIFTFDSANSVHGCVRIFKGLDVLGCLEMTGTRTSATPTPLSLRH
ncbi:hypothetical protein [Deinococcus alpinitundrae]|uniref:hypothetical protein n=1 Tax=Deinococcus alpinitundrae TaxID=468913 RepID=UPI00137B88DB|nr:hypothetical protein [Deinococcus alpinitundrae]